MTLRHQTNDKMLNNLDDWQIETIYPDIYPALVLTYKHGPEKIQAKHIVDLHLAAFQDPQGNVGYEIYLDISNNELSKCSSHSIIFWSCVA